MNCIIIDDEPLAREGMRQLIQSHSGLQLVGSFNNVEAAEGFLSTNQVELVFLDIEMPGPNGIEFSKKLSDKLIIFTTAYQQYALESYDVGAIDYLIKPVRPERFGKAVEKAILYHTMLQTKISGTQSTVEKDHIFIRANGRHTRVNFEDLYFIEGLKDYVVLHLKDKRILTNMILKDIHQVLPGKVFFRVNKSYIINIRHVTGYNNSTVYVADHEISLSSVYKAPFLEQIGII
ncbi:response regulator transcription factor [Pseudoflavitalea sp. G-6-1-2]|uniref:LytR/AlgR family response regulator transcription factor n=1 Tax=Pseudoflavitalea sp. G-6-1-2 TaxID=2728841 RepID=UPI00146AC13A|nr:response regulator transcription factor [Pseudoflavitalea sp. G-6-1-2]NML20803.1 response regulator transcription factor [Pseudoflavitalea sp. G-6-1-2]